MFKNYTQLQKTLLAALISFVVVGGSFGTYFYYSTNKLQSLSIVDKTPPVRDEVTERGLKAVQGLKKTIQEATPEKLIFTEVTLEQLNIYPQNWVKVNFTKEQLNNELISGSQADADSDGVSNLKEFLYGSNPNNKFTFCGEEKPDCKLTDKGMLDDNKSPLTGLKLELPKTFRLKRVDEKIVQGMQESFGVAVSQGLDFPKLYEQSRTLNLIDKVNEIKVPGVKDTRESMLGYFEKRVEVLKEFSQDDELTTFTNIYKLLEVSKIQEVKKQYVAMLGNLNNIPVPDSFVDFHRVNLFVLNKLVEISDHRIETIGKNTFANPQEVEKNQRLAKELFWGYRRMSEENVKIQQKMDPNSK